MTIKPVLAKVLLPNGSISEIDLNQYDMAILNPVTDAVKEELANNADGTCGEKIKEEVARRLGLC